MRWRILAAPASFHDAMIQPTIPAAARPAWSEIDLDALARNVRTIRSMLRPVDRFNVVC